MNVRFGKLRDSQVDDLQRLATDVRGEPWMIEVGEIARGLVDCDDFAAPSMFARDENGQVVVYTAR